MEIKKVDSIWLAAAVNTYEICKTKLDWELKDIYFTQAKIVSGAKNIIKDEVPATMASQQCCAYTSYSVYRYLVAKGTLRRISYSGEFDGDRERPEFDKNMIINTIHGEIECKELFHFIDEEFTPAIKQKLENKYEYLDVELIFKYLEDYMGEKYMSAVNAGEKADSMIEHATRGKAARIMLADISKEIMSFMPKYSKVDTSGWINQGQNVDHYIWSELKKGGKEEFPTSMSIFVEKNVGKYQLRISVEVRDSKCEKPEDYSRHNRLLEKVNINPELKYFVGDSLPNELVVSSLNNEGLKKEVDSGKYKKVQICKFILRDEVTKMSGKEVINFISKAMDELEPFYDLAVDDDISGNSNTEGGNSVENGLKLNDVVNFNNNMILFGPPGTGKTYHTVLYALAICENKSLESLGNEPYGEVLERFNQLKKKGQIAFTTFHQSYGYEEFIEGIKPVISKKDDIDSGDIKYEHSNGIFKKFCQTAGMEDDDINISKNNKPYVFIIDEINRGNISKIFGELITLIEDTKRIGAEEEMKVTLPYTSEEFGVPSNVYLLGTMNTADRSIALIDTALRRRFKFIEMMPDSNILRQVGSDKIKSKDGTKELDIVDMLNIMNQRIECLFDREHTIGHAFFIGLKDNPTIEVLAEIFSKSIIPLLQEYFYEDYSKIQLVLGDNSKSDDKFKFILDLPMDSRSIFKGNPDFDLPDKKYEIQEEALYEMDSYLQIYK